MDIRSNTSGLEELRLRIDLARSILPDLLDEAAQQFGEEVIQDLSDAAPKGKSASATPPEGDGDGPLADSFYQEPNSSGAVAGTSVMTTQPTKFSYVVNGTGIYGPVGQRIVPTTKQALYWEGADHPVRSVLGQKPNDFVSPVLDTVDSKGDEVLQVVIDEIADMLEG